MRAMTGFILAPPQSWAPPDIKLVIRSGGQLLIRWHRIGKNDRSWSLHIGDTWIGGASVPCWQMRIKMYVELHARICAYTHPWIACPVLTDGHWMRVNNAYILRNCKTASVDGTGLSMLTDHWGELLSTQGWHSSHSVRRKLNVIVSITHACVHA